MAEINCVIKPTHIIGKHFDIQPAYDAEQCCMCGDENPCIDRKKVIKASFMDHECLSDSKFICVYCAACVGYQMSQSTALRATSFLATESEITRLKKNQIWQYVENPPGEQHVLVVTFSNKKHIAFKSILNPGGFPQVVSTDRGNVHVDFDSELVNVLKSWYRVCKETKQEPTFFTKNEILFGSSNHKRITGYGTEKYFEENQILERFRNTESLNLLVYLLNKQPYREDYYHDQNSLFFQNT
ncbi:MAG: hypothetical protein MI862_14345 [Desulfobacterales bacterium]|nr:hypothetical protein [Desulfobacterales bacterium]